MMNEKNKKIISIVLIVFILAIHVFDIDEYIPNYYIFLGLVCLFLYVRDIYKSIKYLKNTPTNEIRIRSNNDNYFNRLPFFLGSLFCIFSITSFFVFETEKITAVLLFIIGLKFFFNGFFFIPTALIKFENGSLIFENGKEIRTIQIEQIENITLAKNDIRLKLESDKNYIFSHLELRQTEMEKLTTFLKKHFDRNIELN